MKITNCRLCDQILPEPLLSLLDTPLANEFLAHMGGQETFPLQLTSCSNCHHYQLNYSVDPERLFRNYVFVSGTSPVNVQYFQDYAKDAVERFKLVPGDLVVEIASNDGTLSKAFQGLGMRVLGIDPAANLATQATKEGIETIPEFFTEELANEITQTHGKAKLICANNVLAHLSGVIDIVKGVKSLLAEGGVFIFENSYFRSMYENNLFDLIYSEHESHFLVHPLNALFSNLNMRFFDVLATDVHGGSIRGFVSNNLMPIQNSINLFISEEKKLGLITAGDKNIKMSMWSKKIAGMKEALHQKMQEYKDAGKTVDIYGYPAKLTTLLYTMGMDQSFFRFAYDDAPFKQGKYSPGLQIPVISPKKLMEKNPDALFIGAWNFGQSIMDKCRAAGFTGEFLVPMPTLKVVSE